MCIPVVSVVLCAVSVCVYIYVGCVYVAVLRFVVIIYCVGAGDVVVDYVVGILVTMLCWCLLCSAISVCCSCSSCCHCVLVHWYCV